jgi:putative SOS response-associated peptidase YedK
VHMCATYETAPREQIADFWKVDPREYEFKPVIYPGYMAPIIRPIGDQLEVVSAMFGMVPYWAKDTKIARNTYNSRSETTAEKPSFRNAWKRAQFCIIPAATIYEPCYETGKAVQWGIKSVDGAPFGIAGIWDVKHGEPDLVSFSMLTINADGDPLMQRFHKPEDEKRMVVILRPDQYDEWLQCPMDAAPEYFQRYPAEKMVAHPSPKSKPVIVTKE